jgi:TctA family transporter
MFGVIVMGVAGVAAFFMERWGFPVAPTILGVVLGTMLEEHFFSSLVKADGSLLAFFQRPIAATLGALTLLIWGWSLYKHIFAHRKPT